MICTWGMEHVGYKKYGLPKPRALFPVYRKVQRKSQFRRTLHIA